MKLISLSSNDTRFKTLEFHNGLNIIVGSKRLTKEKKKTSNGIGKSLSLICIDFMLGKGSQSSEIKKLKTVMEKENITLSLIFEHKNKTYNITRTHKSIYINDKKIEKESEYLSFLDGLIDKDYSFRTIFSRFFRTNKDSYNEAIKQVTLNEKPYINNKINAFLLGLNLDYLEKKSNLKLKNDRLKTLIKELQEIQKGIDKEKELEYESRLKEIENNLENFEIAKDFNQLKNEADLLTAQIQKIRNQQSINNREIRNKQNIIGLNKQVDIDIDKISSMYEEAKFFINQDTLAHIEAVKEFHNALFKNRKDRASKDIKKLEIELQKLEKEQKQLDKRRSEIFKYLENKGALEEYHSLNKEKEKIKEFLEDMQRDEKTLKSFKKEQIEIKLEIDLFKKELIDLEENIKGHIEFLEKAFREISEEHYSDKPGYLEIEINDKFNTEKLYNITPIIKGDSSDGINEMKIFIYDMLIYKLNSDLVGLVGHDNRLFDMVDERQIAKAFNYINNNLSQYICSISDTKLNEVKNHIDLDLDKFIIRNLSETDKLFGFDFEE
jgi:uncharacterized protein YydD (DUF2326 family)